MTRGIVQDAARPDSTAYMSREQNRLQQNSVYCSLDSLDFALRTVYVPCFTGRSLLKRALPRRCVKRAVKDVCSVRNVMQPFDAYSESVS